MPNLVQIHPLKVLGKWVKYNKKYLYLYLFSQARAQVRPVDGFFTHDRSIDVKSRKDVPFGGLNDVPLNFGVKLLKKLQFWGRE